MRFYCIHLTGFNYKNCNYIDVVWIILRYETVIERKEIAENDIKNVLKEKT